MLPASSPRGLSKGRSMLLSLRTGKRSHNNTWPGLTRDRSSEEHSELRPPWASASRNGLEGPGRRGRTHQKRLTSMAVNGSRSCPSAGVTVPIGVRDAHQRSALAKSVSCGPKAARAKGLVKDRKTEAERNPHLHPHPWAPLPNVTPGPRQRAASGPQRCVISSPVPPTKRGNLS